MKIITLALSFWGTLWHTIISGMRSQISYTRCLNTCLRCDHLVKKGAKLYCGACNCPQWSGAELQKKLRMRYPCPVGKFDKDGVLTPDIAEKMSTNRPHHLIDRNTAEGRKQVREQIFEEQARQIFPSLQDPKPCSGCRKKQPEYSI